MTETPALPICSCGHIQQLHRINGCGAYRLGQRCGCPTWSEATSLALKRAARRY